jgi:hypothetical protein
MHQQWCMANKSWGWVRYRNIIQILDMDFSSWHRASILFVLFGYIKQDELCSFVKWFCGNFMSCLTDRLTDSQGPGYLRHMCWYSFLIGMGWHGVRLQQPQISSFNITQPANKTWKLLQTTLYCTYEYTSPNIKQVFLYLPEYYANLFSYKYLLNIDCSLYLSTNVIF